MIIIGRNISRKRFDKAGILWYTNQAVERGARERGSGETGAILENDIEKNGKKQSDSEERNALVPLARDRG